MEYIDLDSYDGMSPITTSVCIIGSGPAGGIVATKLAEKKIDVVLLEAGNFSSNFHLESDINTSGISSETDLRLGGSKQLGGASNLWAGRMHPLEAIDLKARLWVNNSGWPYEIDELTKFYSEAAEILGVPEVDLFEKSDKLRKDSSLLDTLLGSEGRLQSKCFQWANTPFTISNYFEENKHKLESLKVFLNADVSRLIEDENARNITHAVVPRNGQEDVIISAKYFVVAAGGIGTPQILLNSTNIRKDGIGNDHDVVGRYFSTHPKADMAALILNKPLTTNDSFFVDKAMGGGSYRLGLGLAENVQEQGELLNHYVQLSPLLEYQATQIFDMIKSSSLTDNRFINKHQLINSFLPSVGKFTYGVIGRLARLQPKTKKFILRTFLDQYPNPNNRVALTNTRDSSGIFKVKVDWKYSVEDQRSVISFFKKMDEELRKADIGQIEFSGLQVGEEWPLIGIHSHFMGTTRLGTDKKISVVDENAAVHGMKNLFISGPSLFTTYGFANPFLTITALSIKLSEHLLKKLNSI